MQFNVNEWRNIYDEVHIRGKMFKDSLPTYDEDKKKIPPVSPLSAEEQKKLQDEIKDLTFKSDLYLDSCNMYSVPLWKYNIEDKRTWKSDSSFAFDHLVRYTKGRKR